MQSAEGYASLQVHHQVNMIVDNLSPVMILFYCVCVYLLGGVGVLRGGRRYFVAVHGAALVPRVDNLLCISINVDNLLIILQQCMCFCVLAPMHVCAKEHLGVR